MSINYYVQVIGSDYNNRGDMFGGIIDLDQTTDNKGLVEFINLIRLAITEEDPDCHSISMELNGDIEVTCGYEEMPFTGTIQKEVLIYLE